MVDIMAKVKSIIKLQGTIGSLNFYLRKGVPLVRTAGGGFNGDAIKTKASMVRVRENGNEFKGCMQTVQFFKQGLQSFLGTFKDGTLHQRLVSLFTKIKNEDVVAVRGSRTVFGGLQTTTGQELLKNYLFSSGSRLEGLLQQKVLFDWTSGFSLPDFDGGRVSFPGGATHLALRVGYLSLDFANFASSFSATDTVYLTSTDAGTILIPAPTLTATAGIQVGVVLAQFVQEVNGQFYPLKNEQAVVLEVVSLEFGV
jgi:hypothetical protein